MERACKMTECCNTQWTRKDTKISWSIAAGFVIYLIIAGMVATYHKQVCLDEDPYATCRGTGVEGILWPLTTPFNIGQWVIE